MSQAKIQQLMVRCLSEGRASSLSLFSLIVQYYVLENTISEETAGVSADCASIILKSLCQTELLTSIMKKIAI